MQQLFDALDGRFYTENRGWLNTFHDIKRLRTANNVVFEVGVPSTIRALAEELATGLGVPSGPNYPLNTATDRMMALMHINQDLQFALLTHGYGFDDDWKCIGGVVAKCMDGFYNGFELWLAETFHTPNLPTNIPSIRDSMREGVANDNPDLPRIVPPIP
jgi:hypothetical protein